MFTKSLISLSAIGVVAANTVAYAQGHHHGGGNQDPIVVRDHRPVVRDHRDPKDPDVRDHRGDPDVRDHRAPEECKNHKCKDFPVTRDHRGGYEPSPRSADHKKPKFKDFNITHKVDKASPVFAKQKTPPLLTSPGLLDASGGGSSANGPAAAGAAAPRPAGAAGQVIR